MKKNLLITIVVLISIFTFGQETKNIVTDFNSANSKVSGLRINSNVDRVEGENTTKFALNQLKQAGTTNDAVEIYEKDAIYANRKPEDELVEKRDRTSKHFQNPDGSIEAILSTGSLNYLENDKWQTIERAITPNNTGKLESFEFANTKNAFKSFYGNTPVNGIKTIVENQEITEWQNAKIDYSVFDFEKGEIYSQFHPESELIEKRGQYAKHFNNDDGSVSAIVTPGTSLHYKENGVWKAIDRQIILNQTGKYPQHPYVNNKNSFASYYPSNPNGGIITEYKEGVVTDGLNKKIVWLDQNYNALSQLDFIATQASIEQNKISYTNVAPNIDLVYYQGNDGRKMDYVINSSSFLSTIPSQAKYLAFSEDFVLPKESKIDLEKNEENQTILLNVIVDNIIVFRYDLPKHYDSNGNEINSYYKVNQNTLYTIVDVDWLQSGLTFPVYIDPTTTVYPTASGNYNTGCIDNQANKTPDADIYVGMRFAYGQTSGTRRFFRAWASFDVTSIPNNATINNVVFGCYIGLNTFDSNYGEQANVSPITSGIPNTQTGGTLYNMCGENSGSDLFSIGAGFTGNASLDITSVVSTFLTNSLSSNIFSLAFRPVGDFHTGFTEQVGLYGSTRPQQTTNGKPYLTISYTVSSGPPTCTTPVSPLNGATGVAPSGTLNWQASAGATSYNVYFGQNYPPTTMIGNTANQFYDVDNMDYNTTYYWQILPTNAGGSASGCDVWSFTTGSAPPQFHNYGGTEQLTFDNSAYKVDNPNFRISHGSTMEEVQIQISQDVTFPGTTVFDGNFAGSFNGENNFETSLSGQVLNESYFPQAFNTDVLTHGTNPGSDNIWFAPSYSAPIAWIATGGNPGGRVGYSGTANWSNFLRTPAINCTGQDLVTLTFDVWHSENTSNWIKFNQWADDGYKNNVVSVKINGEDVTYSYGTGKGFQFSEQRATAQVEVIFDISAISNKSNIQFYFNAICNHGSAFYVYFDNISITGAAQQLTDGTTYYARAKGKVGGNWTDWTTKTHSFTYKNQADTEWYQTAEPQFLTNTLSDVITVTEFGSDFATIPASGGTPSNPFNDPSFETGSGWTQIRSGNWYSTELSSGDAVGSMPTLGSNCMLLYHTDPGNMGYFNGDYVGITQQVDLTGISELTVDIAAWHKQPLFMSASNQSLMQLRVIIGAVGTTNNSSGTVLKTYNNPSSSGSSQEWKNQVIDVSGYEGVYTVKFVSFVTTAVYTTNDEARFYIDNIRATSAPLVGTMTSSPINLSSFFGDDSWHELSWNQALNGGSIAMSIEEDNGGTWTPVAGFTNITQTGDGVKTVDISSLSSISRIRVIAKFSKTGAKGTLPELNSWTVRAKKTTPLPVELLSFTATCNGNSKEFTWETASETNSDYFQIMASANARDYMPVAKIAAAGNSTQNIKYSYTIQGHNDKTYYRLKQTDFDGQFEYFNPIAINCNSSLPIQVIIYPNPAQDELYCSIVTDEKMDVEIQIVNYLGQLCYVKNHSIEKGANTIDISSKYNSGLYLVKVISNSRVIETKKIIIK